MDAAIKEDQNKVGLEVLIRNSEGKCIAVAMKPSITHGSVAFADAKATRLGLEFPKKCKLISTDY